MPVRVISVIACISSLSLFTGEQYSIVRIFKEYPFSRGGQRLRDQGDLEGTVKAVGKAPRQNVKENHLDQLQLSLSTCNIKAK